MKEIKVIVINPNTRMIYEKKITPELKTFYDIINCEMIELGRAAAFAQTNHFMYVDEDGMLKNDKNYFRVGPSPVYWTGIAIVIKHGTGDEDYADTDLTVEQVSTMVTFYTEENIIITPTN